MSGPRLGTLARRRVDGAAVRAVLDRIAFGPVSRNRILAGTVIAVCLAVLWWIFRTGYRLKP